jgi:uncharacterized membrane protein (UPF0127 family)
MSDWQSRMNALTETANILLNKNVIDLPLVDGRILEVYVAISAQERAMGLNDIAYIDLDGMLFVYERPSYTPFTMNNMMMDLDIGWYRHDGSLIKRGTYQAGYDQPLFSPEAYSYVLETEAGALDDTALLIRL